MHYLKEPVCIAGIAITTSNAPGAAEKDIPALWERFLAQEMPASLTRVPGSGIYCVYTRYEGDYTQPYTALLGYRIPGPADPLPDGWTQLRLSGGPYEEFEAAGSFADGAVFQTWLRIWNSGLERAYTTDFEVYDAAMLEKGLVKAGIFIALKE